jgi:hypothetical protein
LAALLEAMKTIGHSQEKSNSNGCALLSVLAAVEMQIFHKTEG